MGKALNKLRAMSPAARDMMKEKYPEAWARVVWEAHREKGRESFWYFDQAIVKNPITCKDLHGAACEGVEPRNWGKKFYKLKIWPRGHIKTNLFTVEHTAWLITRDQEIRVLITSHAIEDAVSAAGAVRAILDSDEYKAVYPEVRPKMQGGREYRWRDDRFRVERKSTLKEDTVETASPGKKLTGRHYNWWKPDDTVNEYSVRSREAMKATTEFVRYIRPLLDPGAHVLGSGTRYNYGDEYGRLIKETEDWDVEVKTATREIRPVELPDWIRRFDREIAAKGLKTGPAQAGREYVRGENGAIAVPIYPTRFHLGSDHEGDPDNDGAGRFSLPRLKRELGSYIYGCQYENNPIDDSAAFFQRDRLIVIPELPGGRTYYFGRSLDASTEADTESRTAILDWVIDDLSNIILTNIIWKQMDPSAINRNLIDGQRRHEHSRPKMVTGEKQNIEKMLKHFLDRTTRETGIIIPWKWMPTQDSQKSKLTRVLGLQSWWEAGKIQILESCPHREDLLDMMTRYPRAGDMDIADALAQIPVCMWPTQGPDPKAAETAKQEKDRRWFEHAYGVDLDLEADTGRTPLGGDNLMDAGVAAMIEADEAAQYARMARG